MKTSRRAFTLVEVLLAASLSMIVITGALFTLSSMLRAYKSRAGVNQSAEIANLILNRIRTDLMSVYFSAHGNGCLMIGTDLNNGVFDTDRLVFKSTVNDPIQLGSGTSDVAEIEYFVDTDDGTPIEWLQRRYDFTPDDDPLTGGTLALLGPRVLSMDIIYYDGLAWWAEWESEEELPIAVNITLGIFFPEEMGQEVTPEVLRQYSTTVWLPSFDSSVESSSSGDEEAGGQGQGGDR